MRNFNEKPKVKSSKIYFQLGLIIALASALFFIEHTTEHIEYTAEKVKEDIFQIEETYHKPLVIEKEKKVEEKQPKPKTPKPTNDFKVVDNFNKIFENTDPSTDKLDLNNLQNPDDGDIDVPDIVPVGDEPKSLKTVSEVPVFPGCEKYTTKKERIECFSDKVARLVNRKFDGGLGAQLGLHGRQSIYVQFTVNKKGEIVNVRANSSSKELAKEAERVTKLLPSMRPGQQNGRPVNVMYALPIKLEIR